MPNHNGSPWVWLTKSAHRLAGGLIIQFCTFFQAEEFIASNLHMACHLANVIFDFGPVYFGNGWKLPTLKWLCMEMFQVDVWPLMNHERVFIRLYWLSRQLCIREADLPTLTHLEWDSLNSPFSHSSHSRLTHFPFFFCLNRLLQYSVHLARS